MYTSVTLVKRTQKGIDTIQEGANRVQMVKKLIANAGGKVVGAYATTGRYDMIWIMEFPNENVAWQVSAAIQSLGTVTFEACSAIPVEQFADMVTKARDTLTKLKAA